jgi:hypothetical protein
MERWAKFLSGDDTSNVVPMKRGGVIKLAISVEAFEAIAPTLRDEAEPNGRMADRLAAFARAGWELQQRYPLAGRTGGATMAWTRQPFRSYASCGSQQGRGPQTLEPS